MNVLISIITLDNNINNMVTFKFNEYNYYMSKRLAILLAMLPISHRMS